MQKLGGLAVAALAAAALAGCASHGSRPKGSVTAQQQFEKLKSLEGTWTTTADSGMSGTIVYRVVGSGSAVQETIFPGMPYEMVSMYHLDRGELVMTHYCAAQNQPSMRAVPGKDLGEIRWEFVRLSNGNPSRDMHMHEGVMRFEPNGTMRSTWIGWNEGKPGGHTADLTLARSMN